MSKMIYVVVAIAVLAGVAVFMMSGCATLGLAEPNGLAERLAYSEGQNTALREASTDALNHREISSQDMEHVIAVNEKVKSMLSVARRLMGVDPLTAEGQLAAAVTALSELQAYLRARGVKTTEWSPLWKNSRLPYSSPRSTTLALFRSP